MTSATLPVQATRNIPRSARIALSMLERLSHGALRLRLPDGSTRNFGEGEPSAELRISDWALFEAVMRRGDIGFAQAWIDRSWDSEDLSRVLGVLVANRSSIDCVISSIATPGLRPGATLPRITIWATISIRSGLTRA